MSVLRFGRYETIRELASGGMAMVYLARAVGAGGFQRLVAVKVMHPHLQKEPDFVSMFLDEARLAAGIRHPNVVATLDVDDGPQGLVLVMEYVEGPSLYVLTSSLRRWGSELSVPIALRVTLDALAGLQAAHELVGPDGEPQHLVHRDVSPQNILVGADGLSRITDFGVARAQARIASTKQGEVKGKVGYMAPEQLKSEALDRRADVYSMGVVLWELLAGRKLFKADTDAALVAQVLEGPAWSPRDVVPSVPRALSELCMRALSRRKEGRFASAAEFAEAIEQAAHEEGIRIASHRMVGDYIRTLEGMLEGLDIPAKLRGAGAAPDSGSNPSSYPSASSRRPPPARSVTPSAPAPRVSTGSRVVSSRSLHPPAKRRGGGLTLFLTALVATLGTASIFWFGVRPRLAPAAPASVEAPEPGPVLGAAAEIPKATAPEAETPKAEVPEAAAPEAEIPGAETLPAASAVASASADAGASGVKAPARAPAGRRRTKVPSEWSAR